MNKNGTEIMMAAGMFLGLVGFLSLITMAMLSKENPITTQPLLFVASAIFTFGGLSLALISTAIKPKAS